MSAHLPRRHSFIPKTEIFIDSPVCRERSKSMGLGRRTTWNVSSLRPICWPNVFNISGPEIDEKTYPDSPLSTSLYLHHSMHRSLCSSVSLSCNQSAPCILMLPAFPVCHIFVFVLCRYCVTYVMCPWCRLPVCFFFVFLSL